MKGILVSLVVTQGKGRGQTAPACSKSNDESWLLALPIDSKLRQSLVGGAALPCGAPSWDTPAGSLGNIQLHRSRTAFPHDHAISKIVGQDRMFILTVPHWHRDTLQPRSGWPLGWGSGSATADDPRQPQTCLQCVQHGGLLAVLVRCFNRCMKLEAVCSRPKTVVLAVAQPHNGTQRMCETI